MKQWIYITQKMECRFSHCPTNVLKSEFPDLEPEINLTLSGSGNSRRRLLPRRSRRSNPFTSNPDPRLRRFQRPHLHCHLGVHNNLNRHSSLRFQISLELTRRQLIKISRRAPDRRLKQSRVLLTVHKRSDRAFTDDDVIVSGGDSVDRDVGGDVAETDVFVRVLGHDGEGYSGGEARGGGEVERGDFEGRDGEARPLRTVDEVYDGGCGGDEEE